MNDQEFFENMEEHRGEKMLWVVLQAARDYIVEASRRLPVYMTRA
jgi:hypothetical protein